MSESTNIELYREASEKLVPYQENLYPTYGQVFEAQRRAAEQELSHVECVRNFTRIILEKFEECGVQNAGHLVTQYLYANTPTAQIIARATLVSIFAPSSNNLLENLLDEAGVDPSEPSQIKLLVALHENEITRVAALSLINPEYTETLNRIRDIETKYSVLLEGGWLDIPNDDERIQHTLSYILSQDQHQQDWILEQLQNTP